MDDGKNTSPCPGLTPEIPNSSEIITDNLSAHCLSAGTTLEQLRAGPDGLSSGAATELGRISHLLGEVEQLTIPLLKQIGVFFKVVDRFYPEHGICHSGLWLLSQRRRA